MKKGRFITQRKKEQARKKSRKAWNEFKDFLLAVILLNMLINNLQALPYEGGGGSKVQVLKPVVEATEAKPETEEQAPDNSPALVGEFSAYTADPAQTDADPTTMANGEQVFKGAIANNCLEFGEQIKVGNEIYTVADRMNRRYGCEHFDIFFEDYDEAIKFGRRELEYQLIN